MDSLDARLHQLRLDADANELLDLGCDLADVGRLEDASRCFERAAAAGSALGAFNLGNMLRELRRHDQAAAAYAQAIEGGEPGARLNLGLVLLDLQRWAEALPALEAALAEGDSRAQAPVGTALLELDDRMAAERAFRAAAAAGDPQGMLQLAFLAREDGNSEEAQRLAGEAAQAGDDMAAGVVACWAWSRTLDPSLEPALRQGADHYPSARAALADLLRSSGRADEARTVLEQGAKLGEKVCWLPLGNLYATVLHDADAAEAAFRSGIAAGDNNSHHNLAELLHDRGDLVGAELHYRLGEAGGDVLAGQALKKLLEER
jgi:tetratricopeptide (TPR) repeat protein